MVDLLNNISHQIEQSKINWSNISSSIGIDRNDVLNIQKKCNPTVEFVYSVTKKIWKDIFDYVGLTLTTNDSYTEVSSILKLGEIWAGRCLVESEEKIYNKIVEEISQKVSQWKIFGRILGLNESYLNQVERDFQSCYEQNHEIMKNVTSPLEPDESWLLWRSYLAQFEDGINVIQEIESTHVELLAETPAEISHIIRKGDQVYIGHSYGYEDNKSIQINKQDSIIGVQVGSKDFNFVHYQEFTEWVTTQQRYINIYDMLKDQKYINFAEGTETFCPILDTMKDYLEITNDPGLAVKGYNYVKHYSLFKKGTDESSLIACVLTVLLTQKKLLYYAS